MRRQDTSTVATVAFALVVSSIIHLGFWWVGDEVVSRSWDRPERPRSGKVMEVSLVPDGVEPDDEDDPTPKPNEQLVKLDAVDEEVAPDDAKYLSEFDNRTDKQTRAPNRRPTPGPVQPPTPPGKPSKARESRDVQQANDEARSEQAKPLDLLGRDRARDDAQASDAAATDVERRDDGTVPTPGAAARPSLSPRAVNGLDGLRQQWGSPGTFDALDDDIEEGEGNLLNSRRFKYASFFNRVRDQIAKEWRPAQVHRAHDPDGSKYGEKPRYTRLHISLNADGSLRKISLAKSCGADFLDEEAIRSVRAAAPFSNPPAGLVEGPNNTIDFSFGFILEVGGRNRIFRYKQ